jgi:thermitase
VNIPVRKRLWLALFIASLCASWQGIVAGGAVSESRVSADVISCLGMDTPSPVSTVTGAERTETPFFASDMPSGLYGSDADNSSYSPVVADFQGQWALEKIQAVPSHRYAGEDPPVLVAVLDTGIDADHEELTGRVVAAVNLGSSDTADDVYGHGTPIAGIIAAADDGLGVIGLAPQSCLINVKVADDNGKCRLSALAEGIIWAVDNGALVINISIELTESAPALQEAVDYAWDSGAVVVAAAGNDAGSQPVYPASYENCIAVTAIREDGTLAPLANYGDWVDVAAPGFNIYSILPGNGYGYKHGTSFAAAYVSGLAALLFPVMTDTSGDGRLNDEVRRAIESGCEAIDIAGTGRGSINVAGSMEAFS